MRTAIFLGAIVIAKAISGDNSLKTFEIAFFFIFFTCDIFELIKD